MANDQRFIVDKIKVHGDPRISHLTAYLNGYTYGLLFSPASPSVPKRGTIFLIHGFPDISMGWRYQIPFLTKLGLDVVAPDSIGYGRTDAPPFKLQDYTYRRAADDIAELARQLGLSQIILGGHDWGGSIVYRVAQYYPSLIFAVFSICTPYFPPNEKYEPLDILIQKRLPNFGYQAHFASGEIEEAVKSKAEIRNFLNNLFGARTADTREVAFDATVGIDLAKQARIGKTKLLTDEEMDYYVTEYARHGVNGPLNWYRNREVNYMNEWRDFFANGKKTGPQAQKDLTLPMEVLFVLAKKDQALQAFMAQKMEERIPKLTRREVDAGHWALWERPEDCNKIIGEWLESKVFPFFGNKREGKL
ncbi:epoxide hydrolase [Cladophialophora carrionii]|uniref:Epoxide hydrolase n=1 Tax=Cladophialophora carrionii TaxID=86049 RepID=A0A1C1CYQ2_9EURO|nr:epoxide hydrolase [Cladophialophora carrionii]